ncbi:olfactory receptor 11A1-like [Rana temporaria]|uniref:olfactory receptor 11A1-like n=1 Tax=Rana temporaria TaxID=8407 RepID=UPI001AADBFA9|nr:olfactory receptor 11A1-like [Rana temporaria]
MQKNQSSVLFFQLLGFQNAQSLRIPLFCIFLIIYIVILSGNFLIMMLVLLSEKLRSPMYFFLSHLSLCEVFCTTNIIPNMLHILLIEVVSIPVVECFLQFYLFGCSTCTESFLLTVMSYDRYLAICYPLHYLSIMGVQLRLHLVAWSWLLGFCVTLIPGILVSTLEYCGPNTIDHFFCDLAPFLKLSCSDVYFVETEIIVCSIPIILFPFLFIMMTYVNIFLTILKIPSKAGRQKAFSTCSSHLIVVCTYYGTLIIVYMVPTKGHFTGINKALSLLYIVVTPFFNPIIYSLRNKELQVVMQKMVCHK